MQTLAASSAISPCWNKSRTEKSKTFCSNSTVFLQFQFKSVRHGHGPLGGGFLLGLLGNVDGFLKVFARVLAFSHQIQHVSGSDVGRHRNRRGFESLPIERQSTFQVSFPHQLLTLLDELRLLALRGSLRE